MPVTQPDLSVRRPALRCLLPGMAVLAALAVSGVSVHAQETDAGLTLKSTGLLDEQLPSTQGDKLPVFVVGDRLKGRPDLDTVIEGNVELRKAGTVIRADRIEYSQPTDQVIASGNVHINRKGDVFEGPLLDLSLIHISEPTRPY